MGTDMQSTGIEARRQGRRRAEASAYLMQHWGLSYTANSLARLASLGKGPVYSFRGPYTEYQDEDLDDFARSKLGERHSKASDHAKPRGRPPKHAEVRAA